MNKLKFWRLERNLSQWELSQASGVGRWCIQLLEAGVREAREIERNALAEALGIETLKLFPPDTISRD